MAETVRISLSTSDPTATRTLAEIKQHVEAEPGRKLSPFLVDLICQEWRTRSRRTPSSQRPL